MSLRELILRPNADPLQADTIPGTRKVNNLPLIIAGTALLLFVGIVGIVMMNRADQAIHKEKETPKTASGATQFAKEYTSAWTTGMVPAADAPPPPAPELTLPALPEPGKLPPATPGVPLRDPAPVRMAAPDPWGESRDRFRNSRLQSFEAALKSRTGVSGVQGSRVATGAPRTTEEVRAQIDASRRQAAGMGNDPMAAYQARLAGLSGQSSQSGQSSGQTLSDQPARGPQQYARDNWTLNEAVSNPAPYTLQAGFVLPAIMISGITSNLPGQVMAQVSQHVYDTPTGCYLLIPQGTRLIGTYNSDIAYGQERVLMAWQRLLFPDGRTLNIQAMPGADQSGNAGFTDKVNNHYFRTFSSAFLLSGVIAAASMTQNSDRSSNERNDSQRASDSLSEALGQTLGTTMAEMIRKNLNIAPTLNIRPGYRFNVMVTKDMVFDGPYAR